MTGLFFGSFNPLHNGHLAIARYLLDEGYCSAVWFVVSPQNPLKADRSLLAEEKRLEMVRLAIAPDRRMKVSDIEFAMPRPSYTADTLRKISSVYPGEEFALVIGSDNLQVFHLWKDYLSIIARFKILVYPRPGVPVSGTGHENIIEVDAPRMRVSSTEIRSMLLAGQDISAYVPAEILPLVRAEYSKFL